MQDTILASQRWRFDSDVTAVFDDMLARSIPQYDIMRKACFDVAAPFVQSEGYIIDLGCSRGEALAPFVERYQNHCIGIEISEPMMLAARLRFASNERVSIRQDDLRLTLPVERACIVLCVLTLQFIPMEYRQRIIQHIYNQLLPGGALVFVEKVLGTTARIDALMVDTYYALKDANGYTPEQIERKRLSLEGVLVPVTAKWNEELLKMAGFNQIDCFWRWMNFAGWIAIK